MKKKFLLFGLCTLLCAACLSALGYWATKDIVYEGSDIQFNTDRAIQINAKSVIVEAASSNFFFLRKESGDVIYGNPDKPPLGWGKNTYYRYGPEIISGGKWLFPKGFAAISIKSSDGQSLVTVHLISQTKALMIFLISLCFIYLLFGLVSIFDLL